MLWSTLPALSHPVLHPHSLCPGGSASHSARVCGTESQPWKTYLVNSLNQVSGAVDVTVVL